MTSENEIDAEEDSVTLLGAAVLSSVVCEETVEVTRTEELASVPALDFGAEVLCA